MYKDLSIFINEMPEEYLESLALEKMIKLSFLLKRGDKTYDRNGINYGQKNRRKKSCATIIINDRLIGFKDKIFKLYTDDGFCFLCKIIEDGNYNAIITLNEKEIEDGEILGSYLKERLGALVNSKIEKKHLEEYGKTYVGVIIINEENLYMNFSNRKKENKIEKIIIKKFKNIQELDLNLKDINLMIGGNNSGKSSILQAIHFGISCGQVYNKYKRKKDSGVTVTYDELLYRPINNVRMLGHYGQIGRKEKDEQIELEYYNNSRDMCKIEVESGRARGNSLGLTKSEDSLFDIEFLNDKKSYSYYVTGLSGILGSEEYRSEAIVKEMAVKGGSNNVFRNIIYILSKQKNNYLVFKNYLKKIFPNLKLIINFSEKDDKNIEILCEKDGIKYPIDSFGTSILQVIQMLSYIILFDPSLIILDEPDAHLHPDNQLKIINLLIKICKRRKIQIIISTHSNFIIKEMINNSNLLWIDDGKLVEYDNRNKASIDMLSGIGALSQGAKIDEKMIKCFVLTEDSNTKFLKLLLEGSGFNMKEVDIWSYKTCSRIDVAKGISEFIKNKYEDVEVIIHRDRDFMEEKEVLKLKNDFFSLNLNLFITEGRDIESYFCNKSHIKELYPEKNDDFLEMKLNSTYEKVKDKIKDKYINETLKKLEGSGYAKKIQEINEIFEQKSRNEFYGKEFQKTLKNELRTDRNISLDKITSFLKDSFLEKIANKIS